MSFTVTSYFQFELQMLTTNRKLQVLARPEASDGILKISAVESTHVNCVLGADAYAELADCFSATHTEMLAGDDRFEFGRRRIRAALTVQETDANPSFSLELKMGNDNSLWLAITTGAQQEGFGISLEELGLLGSFFSEVRDSLRPRNPAGRPTGETRLDTGPPSRPSSLAAQ
jgi:hypothetical protein